MLMIREQRRYVLEEVRAQVWDSWAMTPAARDTSVPPLSTHERATHLR
jgi:hypothetical protein